MSAPAPSRGSVIAAIIVKDLRSFTRDRFWLLMTLVAISWFVALYYLLPDTVDETIEVGVYWTESDAAFDAAFGGSQEGLKWSRYDTRAELEQALGLIEPEGGQEDGLLERIRSVWDKPEPDAGEAPPRPAWTNEWIVE